MEPQQLQLMRTCVCAWRHEDARERVDVLRGPPLTLGIAHVNVPVTCFVFFPPPVRIPLEEARVPLVVSVPQFENH